MTVPLTLVADRYDGDVHHAPHHHDTLQLSLVLSGRVRESVGAATEYASALSVVCKAAGVVHTDDFGPTGARLARLTCPLPDLASLIDDPQRNPDWRWTHDPAIAAPFLRLLARHDATTRACRIREDDPDLVDLLAVFTAKPARPASPVPPAWLTDLLSTLNDEWQPHWRVSDVAKRAGVHPVYLARCVRRWFGVGVADLLRTLRLRAAVSRCVDASGTIADAAHAAGFSDEAHFNRTFRAATGLSPGRYRALVRTFAPVDSVGLRKFKSFNA